ncbi:hypothetical protein [Nocardioides marmorisolisilvae]|uniref:Uncharacterized protein n=1 Tax=Nocardioides marmorisolisilvae TaxID=1542737 RepID=A0A3N0DWA8_9ACTN|nr:hypothetical protein [Nocardioides marmorisolisilvae]RNL79894.1 hypothetical protein EFL95_13235 [Nocardioides marmorisolisilvae]
MTNSSGIAPCYQPPSTADNIGLAIGVGLTWLLTVVADVAIYLGNSNTCEEPADMLATHRGQAAIVLVLALAALPWIVGVVRSRRRLTVASLAVAALFPAVLLLSAAFDLGSNGGWCMF